MVWEGKDRQKERRERIERKEGKVDDKGRREVRHKE